MKKRGAIVLALLLIAAGVGSAQPDPEFRRGPTLGRTHDYWAGRAQWFCRVSEDLRATLLRFDGLLRARLLSEAGHAPEKVGAWCEARADLGWTLCGLQRLHRGLTAALDAIPNDPSALARALSVRGRDWIGTRAHLEVALAPFEAGEDPLRSAPERGRLAWEMHLRAQGIRELTVLLDEAFARLRSEPGVVPGRSGRGIPRAGEADLFGANRRFLQVASRSIGEASEVERTAIQGLLQHGARLNQALDRWRRAREGSNRQAARDAWSSVQERLSQLAERRRQALAVGTLGLGSGPELRDLLVLGHARDWRELARGRGGAGRPGNRGAVSRWHDHSAAFQALDQDARRLASAAKSEDLMGQMPRVIGGFPVRIRLGPDYSEFPPRFARLASSASRASSAFESFADGAARPASPPQELARMRQDLVAALGEFDRRLGRDGNPGARGLAKDLAEFERRLASSHRHGQAAREIRVRLLEPLTQLSADLTRVCATLREHGLEDAPER